MSQRWRYDEEEEPITGDIPWRESARPGQPYLEGDSLVWPTVPEPAGPLPRNIVERFAWSTLRKGRLVQQRPHDAGPPSVQSKRDPDRDTILALARRYGPLELSHRAPLRENVGRWRREVHGVRRFLGFMAWRQAAQEKGVPLDPQLDPINEEIPFMLAEAVSQLSFAFRLEAGGPLRGPEREGWHLLLERQPQGLLSQVWLDLLAAFFQGRLVAVCNWCFMPYVTNYRPRRGQPHYCPWCRGLVKLHRYRAKKRREKEDVHDEAS